MSDQYSKKDEKNKISKLMIELEGETTKRVLVFINMLVELEDSSSYWE